MDYVEDDIGWSHTIKFDSHDKPRKKKKKEKKDKTNKKVAIAIFLFVIIMFSFFVQAMAYVSNGGKVDPSMYLEELFCVFFVLFCLLLLAIHTRKRTNGFKGLIRMTFTTIGYDKYKIRVVSTKRNKHYEFEGEIEYVEIKEEFGVVHTEKGNNFYLPLDKLSESDVDYIKRIAIKKHREMKHFDKGSIS